MTSGYCLLTVVQNGHNQAQLVVVCVEVLWPSQQLRSCGAGQLPINTVPGQA